MPGPSDIRVNPFNNATNYVNLTERHIVPSVSPFVVRLNEVPEKQDPSNMQMYYVDDTTGQTTETALTEVAATPGAGEFRPDYSTNAFDDTSWNTGLIEFSSADAGKIIEVSYTATGTLAGVKTNRYPAWWLDRGDGSDGDFVPKSNVTISGLKQYKSVFIKAGVTVTVQRYAFIKVQSAFVCAGTLTATGTGASGGSDAGGGANGFCAGSGGGAGIYSGYGGGPGGNGNINIVDSSSNEHNIVITQLATKYFGFGGGGGAGRGAGGAGGGCIVIVCREYKNIGTIAANGTNGVGVPGNASGGGGGGGSIAIVSEKIIENGIVSANGGTAGNPGNRGGGADGANGYINKILVGES